MKIGIIGLTENAISSFIDSLNNIEIVKNAMLSFYVGKYLEIDVVAVASGFGKVNATIASQILIDKFCVTHIIVLGEVESIDESLKNVIISSEVAYYDIPYELLGNTYPWNQMKDVFFKADKGLLDAICNVIVGHDNIAVDKVVTGDKPITKNLKMDIIEKYNTLYVDKESASVAHVCYANKIPFIAICNSVNIRNEKNNKNVLCLFLDAINRNMQNHETFEQY